MKRDDEYIRALLFEFEAQQDWLVILREYIGMPAEERKRQYHVLLLCDAGLAKEVGKSSYRLTAAGHDFLDAIRSEGIWQRTRAVVAEEGGSVAFDLLKSLALGFAKKQIEDRTGLKL